MIKLSIIIVAYKNMECLGRCLDSIPPLPWLEVLVVNNTHQNRGFGAGCNLGAQSASGQYLLFLNPDCEVSGAALKTLILTLEADSSIGIAGPQLTDETGQPYLSCSEQPSRKTMPVVYSVLNQMFAHTQTVSRFWFNQQPPQQNTDVGVVSGAAMIMPKELFQKTRGFDTTLFMFWEEVDMARRVLAMGKRVRYVAHARMVHIRKQSTVQNPMRIKKWFKASRYHFMKKYFGSGYALAVETWFTGLEEWRLVIGMMGLLAAGIVYYLSGWWFNPGQLWIWHSIGKSTPWNITVLYWGGIAGAIMGMAGFYNEAEITSPWKAVGASLVIGLLLLLISPMGAVLTVGGGLLWAVCDVFPPLFRLRKPIISFLAMSAFLFLVSIIGMTASYRGFTAPMRDWQAMAKLIKTTAGPDVNVRCVGCKEASELWPLRLWFEEYNVHLVTDQPEIFLTLPPLSQNKYGIANTVRYKVGSMDLSIPF